MKPLCIFLIFSGSLLAQTLNMTEGFLGGGATALLIYDEDNASDDLTAYEALFPPPVIPYTYHIGRRVETSPKSSAAPIITGSLDTDFSAVYPAVAPFYSYFSGGQTTYSPLFRPQSEIGPRADLTTVQPAAPPDPRFVFLDGYGAGFVAIDMTLLSVVSQVPVPSVVGPFGIRPNVTAPPNEVWVLNSGNEIAAGAEVSVVDLSTQSLVTNILTPSIPQSTSAVPVGIVFTADGATAFEAFQYLSPDSSGNHGALVVFDAAGRTVTSTMPLKITPNALLMAPDGLTAYILSSSGGDILYYDVLSGTADLTVATYQPGSEFGYPGFGSVVYIHPDGTRLFWNVGVYLTVFDLTTRQVTNEFNSGLPTTVGRTFSLSQDGARAYFSDPLGDVAVLDTYYGTILAAYNTGTAVSIFAGPPVAP
jgi:hypothetical protein